jgi:hypothetical protein
VHGSWHRHAGCLTCCHQLVLGLQIHDCWGLLLLLVLGVLLLKLLLQLVLEVEGRVPHHNARRCASCDGHAAPHTRP